MADRRRRRRRASQDSEDEEDSASDSGSSASSSARGREAPARARDTVPRGRELPAARSRDTEPPEAEAERTASTAASTGAKSEAESECESEDGVGEAVLSDYDSADPEDNASHSEAGDEEEDEDEEEEPTTAVTTETKAPPTQTTPPSPPRDNEDTPEDNSKTEDKSNVTGERQSGDGQESTEDPETKSGLKQKLDDDEDRKNPAYIPRKGLFFEHDLRGATEDERPKGRNRKLWKDEGRWEHDRFREEEQAPKSREELIAVYGYDIRNGGERRNNQRRTNQRPVSPSRAQRHRDTEQRPLRSWQSTAPHKTQAPPPQTFNQSAPTAPRPRAPPPRAPRNNSNNTAPYRNNEALRPHRGERPGQKVALEFTAGGGGVATTRGGRGFRGAPDDVVPSAPAQSEEPLPDPPVTSVERKSYSLARRSRPRPSDKQPSVEDTPPNDKPWAPPPAAPPAGEGGTTSGLGSSGLSDMDQELARLSLGQNWSQNQSPTSYLRSDVRGLAPPLFPPLEEMSSSGAKRYSSQRQRPDPAPLHLHPPAVMETGHYYEPLSFQGPIYAHGEGPAPLPPQGMLVQPEMHLPHPHPGLHPHQSGGPITNPALYGAPPVSLSPGQPQQLLPPPFYPPPGVMTFPYPAMYPAPPPQAQSQVTYGGVTYYDTVQQQAQPKPSPPRRTSQPVTVKAPPPDLSKAPPPPEFAASE